MNASSLVTLLLFASLSYGQRAYEGNFCEVKLTNETGQCVRLDKCPKLLEDLKRHSIRPQLCSFTDRTPLICCPTVEINSLEKQNENSANIAATTSGTTTKLPSTTTQRASTTTKRASTTQAPTKTTTVNVPNIRPAVRKCLEYGKKTLNWENDVCSLEGQTKKIRGHMVNIGYEYDGDRIYGCGGTILSENYVLVSGNCTSYNEMSLPQTVLLNNADRTEIRIRKIITPPNFNSSGRSNLALLQLQSNIPFEDYLQPACLVAKPIGSKQVYQNSWSDVDTRDLVSNKVTVMKKKCDYDSGSIRELWCVPTGAEQKHYSFLETLDTIKCMYTVVAVSNFNKDTSTQVFTNLRYHLDWIESIVWPV